MTTRRGRARAVLAAIVLCFGIVILMMVPEFLRYARIVTVLSRLNPHVSTVPEQTEAFRRLAALGGDVDDIILKELVAESGPGQLFLGSPSVRRQNALLALHAMGKGVQRHLPAFERMARSTDPQIYYSGIRALSLCGPAGAEALVGELKTALGTRRELILSALVGMELGEDATKMIVDQLHGASSQEAYGLARIVILAVVNTNAICDMLVRHRKCSNTWCRAGVEIVIKDMCQGHLESK